MTTSIEASFVAPNQIRETYEVSGVCVPEFGTHPWREMKDPCLVKGPDGWHLYGSGGTSVDQTWEIYHAMADTPEGPWRMGAPAMIEVINGPEVCAPGVIYDEDDKLFHMFVQRSCFAPNGAIEYLQSEDGHDFRYVLPVIPAIPGGREAGVYDAHPAVMIENGRKTYYLTYSGFADPSTERHRNDIYLARSDNGWKGPWERLGRIIRQEEIGHHNQPGAEGYEWGLEGSQLLQLPSGDILMNAVCFLPGQERGMRQRVFFALARTALGPYRSLGPVIPTVGENGHASVHLYENQQEIKIAFQQKDTGELDPWRVALGNISIASILHRDLGHI